MTAWQRGAAWTTLVLTLFGGAPRADEPAKPAEQTWEGTLVVQPGLELKLVFHIREDAGGVLTATMDSPDQGASDIKVDAVTRTKDELTFAVASIRAKYEGKLNPKGTEALGSFTQGPAKFPMTLKVVAPSKSVAKTKGSEQLWEGKLAVSAGLQLRMLLRVTKDEAGKPIAHLDSPDEGVKGLRLDPFTLDDKTLKFVVKATGAGYEGKLEGDAAVGHWSQSGVKIPLRFQKTDKPTEVRRPQTPKPPFSYRTEDVAYENKPGGVKLAGTLTTPNGSGPFPAVILISGSGAQDRDETLFQHKPFLLLADTLTRRGIAVLRVDDRGVGGSSGKVSTSTSDDFAGDAASGLAYLKTRPEIDAERLGLIGHSEGGVIAPMVAARRDDVAFIVLLAGTGLPGDEILYLQGRLIARAMGAGEEALAKQLAIQKTLFAIAKSEKDPEVAAKKMREAIKAATAALSKTEQEAAKGGEAAMEGEIKKLGSPWFRFFLAFDPRPTLAKVRCPVLALVGEKDLQVPPKENLEAIEKALKDGGNSRVSTRTLPGLNHLFQTCKTGAPSEYATIEETISPSALAVIGDWVVDQVKKP